MFNRSLRLNRSFHARAGIASALVLGCALTGCVGEPYVPPDSPPGDVTEVSGTIDQDATWSGIVHIVADATIAPGVTVTVEPGTWVRGAAGVFLRAEGVLSLAGTDEAPISVYPMLDAESWGGFTAEAGGAVSMMHVEGEHVSTLLFCKSGAAECRMSYVTFTDMSYVIQTNAPATIEYSRFERMVNAGVSVLDGSDLLIDQSYVLTSSGDIVVTQSGSRFTITNSEIGGAQGSYEHCNLHINGAAYASITNSNIVGSVVAMMIANADGAIVNYNNITGNESDIDPIGPNSNVDMRYNYWSNGVPNGLDAAFDVSQPAAETIADAGPSW